MKPISLSALAHIEPRFGGIVTSVVPLCSQLETTGRYRAAVAAFCLSSESPATSALHLSHLYQFPLPYYRWLLNPKLLTTYAQLVRGSTVVHIHGIWQTHCWVTAKLCRFYRKPLLLSAQGMLDPWALNNKRWKKRLYLAIEHLRDLRSATCLQALTPAEAEDYRRLGLRAPIVIIPNGVSPPEHISRDLFDEVFPFLRAKRILLFLGRLHPKKGVHLLIQAWARTCHLFPEAHLVVAGPDFENTYSSLLKLVDHLGIANRVTFPGLLNAGLKWSALAASTVFILPSYSEGFSVAVLEALTAGCVAIVSRQCNFPDIASAGCGWVIDPTIPQLEQAIREALTLSSSRHNHMANAARALVAQRYSWPYIANQIAGVYDWLRGGPPPESLEIC